MTKRKHESSKQAEKMQHSHAGFRDRILETVAERQTLYIKGSGSKAWYGAAAEGSAFPTNILHASEYKGIIAYEPSELYLTVRCGTALTKVEEVLDDYGQMLAFEPPHFGPHATVGGMLACGLSGPRRANAGAMREHVLGVLMMDGRGNVLQFGGQVMKNVAGFDVSRLMVGSLGCLGLILDITLKVLPKPQAEISLAFEMSELDALDCLNRWAGQSLPISASSYHVGRLMLRLSGSEVALQSARKKLGGLEILDAKAYWQSLREQSHHFFLPEQDHQLWRMALPSSAPALPIRCKTMIEWGGAQRWLWTHESADTLRVMAEKMGGHLSRFRYGSGATFAALPAPVVQIHQRLKKQFDPAYIFNRSHLFESGNTDERT